ncbi:MAG: hemolysin III family protein [Planctomycetota bacterium]
MDSAPDAIAVAWPATPDDPHRTTLRGIPDLIAFSVAVPAGVALALHAATTLGAVTSAVFAVGLVVMLGTSGVYHTFRWGPERRDLLARLDYSGIYLLIAASYTPFCLSTDLHLGPQLLALVWSFALLGIYCCLFKPHGSRALRASLYVLLGVAMVPRIPALWAVVPGWVFWLSAVGGASYALGAVIYVVRWPNPIPRHFGHHEVFHLFVFAGAITHYVAVWQIVGA